LRINFKKEKRKEKEKKEEKNQKSWRAGGAGGAGAEREWRRGVKYELRNDRVDPKSKHFFHGKDNDFYDNH